MNINLVHAQDEEYDSANSWRYKDGEQYYFGNSSRYGARSANNNAWKKIDGIIYNSLNQPIEGAVSKGIDISQWQGKIDWEKVKKSDVDFVIIRCGYGGNTTKYDDTYWERNVSECERLGIPFGVYLYSYAYNVEDAKSEAEHVLRLVKGHNLTYPIYYDLEENGVRNSLSKEQIADVANTFCSIIESNGYKAGVYSNLDWFNNYLTNSVFDKFDKWVAQWNYKCDYAKSYRLWQSTSTGSVEGIDGNVDINIDFSDLLLRNGWYYENGNWQYYENNSLKKGWLTFSNQKYYLNSLGNMVTGWNLIDNTWYYFEGSGAMKTGWVYLNNLWYYLDFNGKMVSGFKSIQNDVYFFDVSGAMKTGWQLIDGKYYYFNVSGAMAKDTWIGDYYVDELGIWDTNKFKPQWILNSTGWWYRHEDGSYTTNDFEVINGQTYYFNAAGYMVTGWQLVDDTWYYFDSSGAMKTGWVYVGNIWYYLDNEGKMLTGFQDIAGQRYYFNKDGSLYTGWVHDKNNWYYYTDQGLFKGWLYVNNNWYWLDENGVMLTGDQIINNVKYYFNENGAMHTGWLEKENLWYFYDSGGAMKTGWVFTGNLWYWLNDEGIMQTGYQTINGNQYYFNPNGSMYVGWHYKEGSWYYFGDYGMVRGWLTVNGNFYYLNQDGVMVTGDVTIDGEKYTFAGSGELISSENLRMLESQIVNYINTNAYSGELWSVSVINLSKPGRIDINNRQQQAASLTKLFVMGAVYENYESLVSRYGQSIIDSNLHYMITISDNNAWVNLVTWLGYGNYASGTSVVTTWAQNHGYTLTATYPYSYQNFSSSRDTAQIVADMYNGKLRYSDRMLNLLYQQTRRHKIPAGVPSGVLVGNKTGELADTENDTAIVHGSNCTYVLSVMCTSSKSAGHSQSMIRTISSIVYNYLNS